MRLPAVASLLLAIVVVLGGCQRKDPNEVRILEYGDFGPSAAAFKVIGLPFYQWDTHGAEENVKCNIKVVVYKGPLDVVKAKYPTVKGEVDYRYVERGDAITFLKDAIADCERFAKEEPSGGGGDIANTLKATLRRIEEE